MHNLIVSSVSVVIEFLALSAKKIYLIILQAQIATFTANEKTARFGKFHILPAGNYSIWEIPNFAGKIWNIQDLAARFGKFQILRQDLENSRSCGKIWKIPYLAGKIWKIQDLPARFGTFKILPARFGKFHILPARFGKFKFLPARFGKLIQDLATDTS